MGLLVVPEITSEIPEEFELESDKHANLAVGNMAARSESNILLNLLISAKIANMCWKEGLKRNLFSPAESSHDQIEKDSNRFVNIAAWILVAAALIVCGAVLF